MKKSRKLKAFYNLAGITVPFFLVACATVLPKSNITAERSKGGEQEISEGKSAAWKLSPELKHSSQIIDITPVFGEMVVEDSRKALPTDLAYTFDEDGILLKWQVSKGVSTPIYSDPDKKIRAVALSKDLNLLALSVKNSIKIVSLREKRVLYTLDRVRSRISTLKFYPSGEALLIGAVDGRIYRWLFEKKDSFLEVGDQRNKAYQRYLGHQTVVSSLDIHPEGRVFFSADWSGTVMGWLPYDEDVYGGEYDKNIFDGGFYSDFSTRQVGVNPVYELEDVNGLRVDEMKVSPDGNLIVLSRENGYIEVWKVRGFKYWANAEAHPSLIRGLDISPDGRYIASYGRDNMVRVWDLVSTYNEFFDTDKADLILSYEFLLKGAKKIVFSDSQKLLVGMDTGKLIEVDLSKLNKVMPENEL